MIYDIELAKGKGLGLKDMDLNKIYIWVNGSKILGAELFKRNNMTMKLVVGDSTLNCFFGDSTQHIRLNKEDSVLIHLMVDIKPVLIGALLVNNLKLILE